MIQKTKIAIALGSNLGDRLSAIKKAAERIREDFLAEAVCANVYETAPWGIVTQPDFLNTVLVGVSEWNPTAIVNFLKRLETELGRLPGPRFGPRLIDLDLLAYGEESWASDGVTVPHPGIPNREFVLVPLADVWPQWKHPMMRKTPRELLERLLAAQKRSCRRFGPALTF